MSEVGLKIINQVDMLVHPDSNLKSLNGGSENQDNLRKRWIERCKVIANNPSAVMFYFSDFILYGERAIDGKPKTIIDSWRHPRLWAIEKERIRTFKGILGDRLFVFAGNHLPSQAEVEQKLGERGFAIDSEQADIIAYGVYYKACVAKWREHTGSQILTLSRWVNVNANTTNQSLELSLSLR